MKILHELNQLEKGGAERIVAGIVRHDHVNEHVVYAYKDGPMREVLEKAGARILLESDETENVDCDIIHLHTGGDISQLAEKVKNQITTVETIHSPVVSSVRDSYIHARVGVSNVVTALNRKCRTIYNGIDVDRLEASSDVFDVREELGIPDDAFVIGRLGRVGTDKCLEEFLLAGKLFLDSHEGIDCHMLIVGSEAANSPGHMAVIKVMAASLPVKNVHFVSNVENVGDYYNAMDVFLYPSPTEGFGLVYMEAMACGVPVIAYDNELTRELMLGAALLVDNTINDLVSGLNLMYESGAAQEYASLGPEHVEDSFTEQEMSDNYQKFYKEIYEQCVKE